MIVNEKMFYKSCRDNQKIIGNLKFSVVIFYFITVGKF